MDVVQIGVIASAAATAAAGIAVAVIRRGEKLDAYEARTEQTFARLYEKEQAKRETERGDCTERIETLRGELGEIRDDNKETKRMLGDCQEQHAEAILERHRMSRELRDLRGIISVIRPDSDPPPAGKP